MNLNDRRWVLELLGVYGLWLVAGTALTLLLGAWGAGVWLVAMLWVAFGPMPQRRTQASTPSPKGASGLAGLTFCTVCGKLTGSRWVVGRHGVESWNCEAGHDLILQQPHARNGRAVVPPPSTPSSPRSPEQEAWFDRASRNVKWLQDQGHLRPLERRSEPRPRPDIYWTIWQMGVSGEPRFKTALRKISNGERTLPGEIPGWDVAIDWSTGDVLDK